MCTLANKLPLGADLARGICTANTAVCSSRALIYNTYYCCIVLRCVKYHVSVGCRRVGVRHHSMPSVLVFCRVYIPTQHNTIRKCVLPYIHIFTYLNTLVFGGGDQEPPVPRERRVPNASHVSLQDARPAPCRGRPQPYRAVFRRGRHERPIRRKFGMVNRGSVTFEPQGLENKNTFIYRYLWYKFTPAQKKRPQRGVWSLGIHGTEIPPQTTSDTYNSTSYNSPCLFPVWGNLGVGKMTNAWYHIVCAVDMKAARGVHCFTFTYLNGCPQKTATRCHCCNRYMVQQFLPLTLSCARNVQTMRLLSTAEDTSCFMSGEYETEVTAAPRPRKVRSSSGSTAVKDEREALAAAAAAAAAPLRLVLAVDSGGDPPGMFPWQWGYPV